MSQQQEEIKVCIYCTTLVKPEDVDSTSKEFQEHEDTHVRKPNETLMLLMITKNHNYRCPDYLLRPYGTYGASIISRRSGKTSRINEVLRSMGLEPMPTPSVGVHHIKVPLAFRALFDQTISETLCEMAFEEAISEMLCDTRSKNEDENE